MAIVLVAIAVIGSYSLINMRSTLYSVKLSNSLIDYSLAQQRAQLALAAAQGLEHHSYSYNLKASNQPVIVGRYPQLVKFNGRWLAAWRFVENGKLWRDSHYAVQHFNSSSQILSAYIVERLLLQDALNSRQLVRVTSIGFGQKENTSVMIQAVLAVKKNTKNERLSWQIIR